MITLLSRIKIICNSGASQVRIFKICNKRSQIKIGTIVQASVIALNKSVVGKVKRKDKVLVLITHTKKFFKRADGTHLLFNVNAGVLVKNKNLTAQSNSLIGNRITLPVPVELSKNFNFVIQASKEIV